MLHTERTIYAKTSNSSKVAKAANQQISKISGVPLKY
jgi:hypothetical protein